MAGKIYEKFLVEMMLDECNPNAGAVDCKSSKG